MRIQLYVLRELLVACCFTLGGVLVLALPAVAVSAIHKLPGVELGSVLLYLPLVISGFVPYALPLSFLLAVVSTYGRLAADNEWTAIRMSGMHPLRVLLPGFAMALCLSAPTLWLLGEYLPSVRQKQSSFMVEAVAKAVKELSPGRTEIQFGDFQMGGRRRDGSAFLDAFVYVPPLAGQPERDLRADRIDAVVEDRQIVMRFRNARTVLEGVEVHNGDMSLRYDLDELRERGTYSSRRLRYQSIAAMYAELRTGPDGQREADLRYEIHFRISMASAFFVFLLLGAPTGLSLRRGNQLPALAAAAGYALAFYVLHMRLGKKLALGGVLAPELCAWAVPVAFLVLGAWLTKRVLAR